MHRRSILRLLTTAAPLAAALSGWPPGPARASADAGKGPGFGPDGQWLLTPDQVAALPVIPVDDAARLWRQRIIALDPVPVDARWQDPSPRAPKIGAGIARSFRIDWMINPATGRWDFPLPLADWPQGKDQRLVVYGHSSADPAAALAASLLRARGYARTAWMRGGVAEWTAKGNLLGLTPLG